MNIDRSVLCQSVLESRPRLLPDPFKRLTRDVDERSDRFELTLGRLEEGENGFDVAAVVDDLGVAEANGESVVGALVERGVLEL